jgi:hypothetical protein
MKDMRRRARSMNEAEYCNHCSLRLGSGERYRVEGGKTYHISCYTKILPAKISIVRDRPASE